MTARALYTHPFYSGAFRGRGFIASTAPGGLVTVNSVPAAREIELRHRRTRAVVATKFSKADGTILFDGYDPAEEFDLIGRDWTGIYNDVIVSRIHPEPY